ncbi:hypothetical protein [Novosphingobium percolationis]|uniref:hypothetical protein n=1 Tax=Novosphingobium percolationis TaxID=2871811 RepID=UPI001CD7E793|nr:hypothetical protein [Novosphingobium percolationis]
MGTSLEDRPRYTSSTTFRTFPFPAGLTPDIPAADYAADPRAIAIAAAAARLNELRENWLNPAVGKSLAAHVFAEIADDRLFPFAGFSFRAGWRSGGDVLGQCWRGLRGEPQQFRPLPQQRGGHR